MFAYLKLLRLILLTPELNTKGYSTIMKKLLIISAILVFSTSGAFAKNGKTPMWIGLGGGYSNGLGGNIEFSWFNISRSIPLSVHFSVGYFHQDDPGNAIEARKVFINDGTAGNDNIIESGYNIFLRLDLSYQVYRKKGLTISPYLGVAHDRYLAHFDYQGGNEAFDVASNPWGVGAGARFSISPSRNLMLSLILGAEYFFPTQIKAHGTFYNPNGEDDSPRNDYTYSDADDAIEQPNWNGRFVLTLSFRI